MVMLTNHLTPVEAPPCAAPHVELQELGPDTRYSQWQQLPTYTVLWIQEGIGSYNAALSRSSFADQTLLFFAANQPFRLDFELKSKVRGVALHFGADFYCLEKHQAELACKSMLFNVLSEPVAVQLGNEEEVIFSCLVTMLRSEMQQPALAQREMLASCLKMLLIRASRLHLEQSEQDSLPVPPGRVPAVLQELEQLIERYYHQKHTPSDYADLLHLSPKALGKLTRTYCQRSLTELIQGRIVVEAKRKLYLTNKSVKEIAYALGFSDQYYFSRFFKRATRFAPQQYRRATSRGQAVVSPN
jgi:AraC-like DNA-binding protein